jgi:transcriptional regulator with XRE-family HTH domain
MNDTFLLALVRKYCADGTARRLRVEARLSLQDVADACSVDVASASRWERNKACPQRRLALRYGEFLVGLAELNDSENRNASVDLRGVSQTEADGPHVTV